MCSDSYLIATQNQTIYLSMYIPKVGLFAVSVCHLLCFQCPFLNLAG